MKHFWTGLLALGVVGCTAPQQTQKDNISGIRSEEYTSELQSHA